MALSAHLDELSERHKTVDQKLQQALRHPSVDTLEIAQLKREKLKLKDEINRLQREDTRH